MLLIFDLDDTLYDESQYVASGFNAVADYGEREWQLPKQKSLEELSFFLKLHGRGKIFDSWLIRNKIYSKINVRKCVSCYRKHTPVIFLNDAAKALLPTLSQPLYLVTDGNKIVQQKKIEALNIKPLFKDTLITHRYGLHNAKPSVYCFEKIRQAEYSRWEDMCYIGDNPNKDFVNLNKLNMNTIRVLTGMFRNQEAKPGYDAQHTINNLHQLPKLLKELAHERRPAKNQYC